MSQRLWTIRFFGLLILASGIVVAFNWWMDPYMYFEHSHSYNNKQHSNTETQAKYYHLVKNPGRYQQAILGGSGAAHINVPAGTFNFSVSGFTLLDTPAMVEFLLKTQPQIKRIFICVAGFHYLQKLPGGPFNAQDLQHLTDPFFRFQNLFNFNTLRYSLRNFMNNFRNASGYYYDRKFRVYVEPQKIEPFLEEYVIGDEPNPAYADYLRQIKNIKNVEWVLFTNPISEDGLRVWYKHRKSDYENWLRDLVRVSGRVEHFAWLSEIAKNSSGNFVSDTHFYTPIGDKVFSHLTGNRDESFGVTLTPENIEAELKREEDLL